MWAWVRRSLIDDAGLRLFAMLLMPSCGPPSIVDAGLAQAPQCGQRRCLQVARIVYGSTTLPMTGAAFTAASQFAFCTPAIGSAAANAVCGI